MESTYKDKVILVTGGSGSIGSEIVKKLLEHKPETIRVLDNNETALFELEEKLNSYKIRTFVGDVRDKDRLERAFENVDILFHAAALKHVPLCEFNPFDAVKTNVLGTQNVLDAALDQNVGKVIVISTDKAVNPVNVMGATKLLSERLTISANHYRGNRKTAFSCVRFGNVLNSRGSIIPIFRKQIMNGGPVTITDSKMSRFIMHIPDSADLILTAGYLAKGGEIFILKMPAVKIVDLADVMIKDLAPKYGYEPEEISVEFIGKRPGEKMYEELVTEDEAFYVEDKGNLFILNPTNKINSSSLNYNSDSVEKLSKREIREKINDLY
jgi:UDP-N-acetylglucosamine 4,6-dehydratase